MGDVPAYGMLFDAVHDPCAVTSDVGLILAVNPALARLLSSSPARLVGKPLAAFVDPDDRKLFRSAVTAAATRGERVAVLIGLCTRSQTLVPVSAEVLVDDEGGRRSLLWLLHPAAAHAESRAEDVLAPFLEARTASLREALEDAGERESLLRDAWDHVDVGVLVVDARSREARVANPALLRMLGVDAYERSALRLADATRPDDASWPPDYVLRTKVAVSGEHVALLRPDGTVVTLLATALPVVLRGRVTAVVATFVDLSLIAERERAEADFIADAAHNLRTPLTVLSASVEVLQAGAKDVPDERDHFLAHIEREVERMTRMTRSLLTLASLDLGRERVRRRDVEAAEVLDAVAPLVAPREGVEVVVDAGAGLVAHTDAALLEQALTNLAENAARYTASGRIALRAEARDHAVAFSVTDTGVGMPEPAEQMFRRFARGDARSNGFGLGLSIVQKIADALSATVEVTSEPDVGTSVSLLVPAAGAP